MFSNLSLLIQSSEENKSLLDVKIRWYLYQKNVIYFCESAVKKRFVNNFRNEIVENFQIKPCFVLYILQCYVWIGTIDEVNRLLLRKSLLFEISLSNSKKRLSIYLSKRLNTCLQMLLLILHCKFPWECTVLTVNITWMSKLFSIQIMCLKLWLKLFYGWFLKQYYFQIVAQRYHIIHRV